MIASDLGETVTAIMPMGCCRQAGAEGNERGSSFCGFRIGFLLLHCAPGHTALHGQASH